MARAIFRFPFMPPFSAIAENLVDDDDFLSDAKILLNLEDSKHDDLAKALLIEKAFLDREKLKKVVQAILGVNEHSNNISRIIWRLHTLLRRDSDISLEQSFDILRDAIKNSAEKIPPEDRSKLVNRIKDIVVSPRSLTRQQKAEELVEVLGTEVTNLQFICDIRPLFNEERSRIEGAIPISTLKIATTNPDGSDSSLELRLTETQILELCDKAQFARNKLLILKNFLSEKELELPNTKATVNELESP
jgi:hypothetical protein